MVFLDLVKQRYSCRSYQEKSVEQEKLDYVMECVRFAPSAVNKQPWMFRVVKNEADKAKLQECYNREWFSTVGGTPHLDGQYTVFGEVEEGLDVVEMIQGTAIGRADRPVDDIEMRMTVIE